MFDVTAPKRTVVFIGKGLDRSGAKGSRIGEVITLACDNEQAGDVVALLRARLRGFEVKPPKAYGVKLAEIDALAELCRNAKYGVVVWAPPSLNFPHADLAVEQFTGLVKDLNQTTRFAGLALGGAEGAVTASAVCTWISGYPLRVSYASGAPDYDPYRHAIGRMLKDGEGDLLMWIASISPSLVPPPTKIPTIVLGTPGLELTGDTRRVHPGRHPRPRSCRPAGARGQRRELAAQGSRSRRAANCRRCDRFHRIRALGPGTQHMLIKLTGGKIYDPANKVSGEVRDIYVEDGKIVAPKPNARADATYDVKGRVIMAGAIDPHTHIGGGKMTIARMLLPEDHRGDPVTRTELTRAGSGRSVPSTHVTGYRYAEMGYTACFEPAMLPANARQAHMEMGDTPMVDKGAFAMLGSDDYFLRQLAAKKDFKAIKDYVAWTMHAAQAIAVKVVNPGGISAFKFNQRALDLDEEHVYYHVTPRQIIQTLARAIEELGVTHPLHIHGCNLGVPGNIEIHAGHGARLRGPAHAHDAYPVLELRHRRRPAFLFRRGAPHRTRQQDPQRLDRRRPGAVRPDLHRFGRQHAPIRHRQERASQEAGDHGHRVRRRLRRGADALSRQELRQRHAMGDRARDLPAVRRSLAHLPHHRPPQRRAVLLLSASHPAADGQGLPRRHVAEDQSRRAGPERAAQNAHPRIYARRDRHSHPRRPGQEPGPSGSRPSRRRRRGDITVYRDDPDREAMFATPEYVFKDGELVVKDGKVVKVVQGATHVVRPDYDKSIEKPLNDYFDRYLTVRMDNFKLADEEIIRGDNGAIIVQPTGARAA